MHSQMPPSGFRDLLISILRASVALKAARMLTTPTSLIYRRRAAAAARLAEAERDEVKMLPLMHQALSWIQLAENEEAIEAAKQAPSSERTESEPAYRTTNDQNWPPEIQRLL